MFPGLVYTVYLFKKLAHNLVPKLTRSLGTRWK
jgi:hypothetical protein